MTVSHTRIALEAAVRAPAISSPDVAIRAQVNLDAVADALAADGLIPKDLEFVGAIEALCLREQLDEVILVDAVTLDELLTEIEYAEDRNPDLFPAADAAYRSVLAKLQEFAGRLNATA